MKATVKIFPLAHWALACSLLLGLQSLAWAHAFLDHSEPRVSSTVTHPPGEVKIWFTQELEPAFRSVEVKDAQGQQVYNKDVHVDTTAVKLPFNVQMELVLSTVIVSVVANLEILLPATH